MQAVVPSGVFTPLKLFEELAQWEDLFATALRPTHRWPQVQSLTTWIDVFEEDGKFVIKADMPGVQKDAVEVKVEDGSIVIEGRRDLASEDKERSWYRQERTVSTFVRKIPVNEEVADLAKVSASLKDGVLTVEVPKVVRDEKPKARKIEIQ